MKWFKEHKALAIIGVVLLLAVIGSLGGGNQAKKTDSSKSVAETKVAEPAMPKVGSAVRDGKFEFVVKEVKCGDTTVGTNEFLTKTAQGQFCLLSLSVKNIGDVPQSLFSSNQALLNAQGQKYASDDIATSYITSNASTWYNNINPGNSVEGVIVFDLPKDQTPTVAELHDSAYSLGVKVDIKN